MKVEVLLSVMNLNKKDLDKFNITTKCTVINQTNKEKNEKYKNFNIYSYQGKGVSNSRNIGLEKSSEDILIFCDDDVVFNNDYDKIILKEFKNNPKADVIMFNFDVKNRKKRIIKKRKRLHITNSLNYATYNIAVRRKSILKNKIKFDPLFGPGAKYNNGSDTMFIKEIYKHKLKVYSSPEFLGVAYNNKSTWFKDYNEKYFFNKGVLFTAINKKLRHLLCLQYLIRHKNVLTNYKLIEAYKIMLKGSNDYLEYRKMNKK